MKRDIFDLIPQEYLPDSGGDGSFPTCTHAYKNPEMHKAWRGFESPITARLLCPVNYLQRTKEDPGGCVRWKL